MPPGGFRRRRLWCRRQSPWMPRRRRSSLSTEGATKRGQKLARWAWISRTIVFCKKLPGKINFLGSTWEMLHVLPRLSMQQKRRGCVRVLGAFRQSWDWQIVARWICFFPLRCSAATLWCKCLGWNKMLSPGHWASVHFGIGTASSWCVNMVW